MVDVLHLNCGWLHKPPLPAACCHCLVVRSDEGVLLVDSGIGMHDVADPEGRIGRAAIDMMGFRLIESVTAVRQLKAMGIDANDVTDVVLTHCDHDHAGGLADFPAATVHVSAEEIQSVESEHPRYGAAQFSHGPKWVPYEADDCETWGLPSRRVQTLLPVDVRLIPLFGHTAGHCGVAIGHSDEWILHVGDAYYLRGELTDPNHPIGELATAAAVDNERRVESLNVLRGLMQRADFDATYFGYHDVSELPAEIPLLDEVATL